MEKRDWILVIIVVLAILVVFLVIIQGSSTPSFSSLKLVYIPLQCVDTPWEIFYKSGSIQFFKEPSTEQLVKLYYTNNYSIELLSYDESKPVITCSTCNVCDKGYNITIRID